MAQAEQQLWPKHMEAPVYPQIARTAHITGTVTITVITICGMARSLPTEVGARSGLHLLPNRAVPSADHEIEKDEKRSHCADAASASQSNPG